MLTSMRCCQNGINSCSQRITNLVVWLMGLCLLLSATLASAAAGWSTAGSLKTGRVFHTATLLPNGKVLVVGGADRLSNGKSIASAELYDPATNTWSLAGSLATARSVHSATLLPNGKVLVAGGTDSNGLITKSVELYNPASNTWASASNLATGREGHSATLLSDGKVLVAGGGTGFVNTASAELYDPAANTWTSTGSLAATRLLHTATLLSDGKVLVTGGIDALFLFTIGSAELYDPVAKKWTSAGSLATTRYAHTATLFSSGKVLVVGGLKDNSVALDSMELYNPYTNTWTSVGNLSAAVAYHVATLLYDGRFLVAALNGSALYDATTDAWTNLGSLKTARMLSSATLLPNGKVLVAGGETDPDSLALNSAELYDPGTAASSSGSTNVIEFYNTNLDNYFITADSYEASAIDGGAAGAGWIRTSNTFKSGGSSQACRFYGSPKGPNSHFYTADAGECAYLKSIYNPAAKSWKFESYDFLTTVPVNGSCPTGTQPVYRAYNKGSTRGVDSNHRITTSFAAIQQVVERGWNNEGVVMCAPN